MENSESSTLKIHVPEDSNTSQQSTSSNGTSNQVKQAETSKAEPTAPKKNLWKTVKTATTVTGNISNASAPEDPKTTLKSVAKRVNRQIKAMTLIKRWTQMTSHSQFANDKDHLQYMRDTAKDAIVAIPDPLISDIREEVLAILVDILKQYKMELGANHPLTLELQTKIQTLRDEMMTSSAREPRRDAPFFRRLSVFNE